MTVNRQARGGSLLSSAIEVSAFLAERLSARSLSQILLLDIIACITVGVVVVNVLLYRVPRRFLWHLFPSHC